jgi:chromate transport protein ChrA
VKRKLRPPRRESWITIRITNAGAVFYGPMVVILFAGFALGHLAPDTTLGHYMKSGLGQLVFAVTLTVVWTLSEALLRKRGFQFYRHVNRNG